MNFFDSARRFYALLIAVFLLIGCMALLPSCTTPTEQPSDGKGDGGGDTPPVTISYSEGLAYEEITSSSSLLENLMNGLPLYGNQKLCIITGIGTCTDTDIVIPPFIGGMRVIGVADRAFAVDGGQPAVRGVKSTKGVTVGFLSSTEGGEDEEPTDPSDIESVNLPYTVLSIGEEAFLGCEALSDVVTPNLIQLIGKDAFKNTAYYNNPANWDGDVLYLDHYLVSVKPSISGALAVKDGTTVIAARAFYACAGLTSIQFPDSICEVGSYAFFGCTSLLSVDLNCRELYIGESAFEGCSSLHTVRLGFDGELYHPGMPGVEQGYDTTVDQNGEIIMTPRKSDPDGRPYVYPCRIRYHAFLDCTALKTVELRRTVSFIGSGVFKNCESLESITLPDTVTSLNMGVIFDNCKALKSVTFGSKLTAIGTQTFYKCPALTELSFPDGVTMVSDVAWFSGVKRLRLGASVTSLTWTQSNLEYVEFGGTMAEWQSLTSKSLVFLAPTHTVVCRDGTITKTEAPPPEKEIYEVISQGAYSSLMNGGLPQNYSSVFTDKIGGQELSVHTMVTADGFHQRIRSYDGEKWELRGVWEGDVLTVYTKRNGRWYRSSATMYGAGHSPYEWKLPFGLLSCDKETFLYTYVQSELGAAIALGFREERLVYASLTAEDVDQTTEYLDFGTTELPAFSTDEVVEGVILDINGDIVSQG